MNAVSANQLVFSYPSTSKDIRPFTLKVPELRVSQGERLLLMGPSGCGKSTLLNLIAGALKPSEGSLLVSGLDMTLASETRRRSHRIQNMGFVFQDFPLVDYLNALENVLLPYRINPALKLDHKGKQRALELLAQLDLKGKENRRPAALSQGERQRVAIARSLVTEPTLLLADEPTAGLDHERGQGVMDLLESLVSERQLTLIMVSHDLSMKSRFGTILDMGKLE